MSSDFDLSSSERVLNLINRDNVDNIHNIKLTTADVEFSAPSTVVDGDKNTELVVSSLPNTRTVGSVVVRYNRLDLNGLKDLADIPIAIEEGNVNNKAIVDQINNIYGCNISVEELEEFSVEDIDFEGGVITFRAKSDSLAWINEIELLVKLDQDLLSNVFVNTDLQGLNWPFVFEGILTQLISFSGNVVAMTERLTFELGNELVVETNSNFYHIDLSATPPVVNNIVNLYLGSEEYLPEGSGETAITCNGYLLNRSSARKGQTAPKSLKAVNWSQQLPDDYATGLTKAVRNLFEYKGNYSIIVSAQYRGEHFIIHLQYDKVTLSPILENRIVYDGLSNSSSTFLSVVNDSDLYILPSDIHSSRAEGSQYFKVRVLDLDSNTLKREFFLPYGLKPNTSPSTSKISFTVFRDKLVAMSQQSGEYRIYASDDKGETWYELYSGSELVDGYQPYTSFLKVFDDRLLIVSRLSTNMSTNVHIIELM